MKRFTSVERAALILAAVLIFGGASLVIWPRTGWVPHQVGNALGTASGNDFDELTPAKSRTLGVVAMAFGAGLAGIAIYRGKS